MVKNDNRKTKLNSQKNWSKVKVTGQDHRGQITIKRTVVKLLSLYLKKLLTDFNEFWQHGVE